MSTEGAVAIDGSSQATRILLVDDDAAIQESLSALLAEEGYEVCTSSDGRDALAQLQGHPPDLIILDLMLPVMDGWRFRALQRADPRLSDIPVIAISADASAKAEAIHADHYLRKPFSAVDLLLAIERVLLGRERQKLTDRLRRAERLALLGTVAAGVGHEINNPLTYVLGNLQLVNAEIAAFAPEVPSDRGRAFLTYLQDLLRDVQTGAERIRVAVGSLRWLSRPRVETYRSIDVCRVLESSIAIAFNEIRHRARLDKRLGAVPPIHGDEARLGQVFVNLLVNAAQAIPSGNADSQQIGVILGLREDFVTVEISDTGCGIGPDLHDAIFEPFYTTKDAATGTGLGLAISRNIVQEHGGSIELESTPGRGSLFRVLLPLRRVDPRIANQVFAANLDLSAVRQMRVLAIDDDPLVLGTVQKMLSPRHTVLAIANARTALDRLAHDRAFDALLCDLMMRDMTGMDFYREVSKIEAGLASRIVFMTGGAFAPEARAFLRRVPTACLYKPFTPDALQVALIAAASTRSADDGGDRRSHGPAGAGSEPH